MSEQDAPPAKKPEPKREPNQQERDAIAKAKVYCRSRTQPLAYDVTKTEGREITIDIPHNDAGGFIAQQRATFGTVSPEFASRTAADVCDIVRDRGEQMPAPDKINAGIAAVAGIEPQNEYEAMLAVQMVGTHSVAMDMLSRAKQASTTDAVERYGTLATKMLRTYTAQLEALSKLRRGGAQKVTVEHVHVYEGGQAIVGNVNTHGTQPRQGGGGRQETGHQPHALTGPAALAFQADPTMLCPDAGREAVPVASGERENTVPNARRRQGKRRSAG